MPAERPIRHNTLRELSTPDKKVLFYNLAEAEINFGCGGRPCRMCSDFAPKYQGSMPFSDVQEIHDLKREFGRSTPLHHYRRSDPLYYHDEVADKNYADVIQDAYKKGVSVNDATHGFLPWEEIPQKASTQLVQWARKNNIPPFLTFSLDPIGYMGLSQEVHEAAVSLSIRTLGPIAKDIIAFYNPNDSSGEGSLAAAQALVQKTIPAELLPLVKYDPIVAVGRAADLDPVPPIAKPFSVWGYSIRFNGDVMFEPDYDTREIEKVGNMYSSLKTPLKERIPRAPDFDEFD